MNLFLILSNCIVSKSGGISMIITKDLESRRRECEDEVPRKGRSVGVKEATEEPADESSTNA